MLRYRFAVEYVAVLRPDVHGVTRATVGKDWGGLLLLHFGEGLVQGIQWVVKW